MIQVACPHCRALFSTAASNAGGEVSCPQCAGRLGVPAADVGGVAVLCPHCRRVFQAACAGPGDTVVCPQCKGAVGIPGERSGGGAKILAAFMVILLVGGTATVAWFATREPATHLADNQTKKEVSTTSTDKVEPATTANESAKPTIATPSDRDEAEAALRQGDAERGRALLQAAYEKNPQDTATQELLKALQDYLGARGHLASAAQALTNNDINTFLTQTKKAAEFVGPDFQQVAGKHKSLNALLDKTSAEVEKLFTQALTQLRSAAKEHGERGNEAWRTLNYAGSADAYAKAASEIAKAADVFPAFKAVASGRLRTDMEQKEQETRERLAELQRLAKRGEGNALLQKGKDLLRQGKVQMVLAEQDGRAVFKAQASFDAALKLFNEAAAFPETKPDAQIASAKQERLRADSFLQPVALDAAKQQWPAGWTFAKRDWAFLKKGERFWLQAQDKQGATAASPTLAIPPDFDLDIQFAVANRNSDIQNEHLSNIRDALTITLVAKTGRDLVISLGKDPGVVAQNYTRLMVGKKSIDAHHVTALTEPIALRLVRIKERGSLSLGGRDDVMVLPLADDFHQLRLTLRNGFNNATNQYFAFPIVLGVSLKMHLEDAPGDKGK